MLKKITKIALSMMLFGLFTFPVLAQESDSARDESTESVESSESSEEDNPVYTIYVHAQCPHCQNVERFVAETGLEDNVRYKELLNNESNLAELEEIWEENNIPEGEQGWPFMIVSEDPFDYSVGDTPIIAFLGDQFGVEGSSSGSSGGSTSADDSSGDTGLLAIGGLVVLGVLGYGIYSLMGEE